MSRLSNSPTLQSPEITEIQPEVMDPEVKKQLLTEVQEEGQVIVHCAYQASEWGDGIRIWRSTFLVDKHSGHRSKLIHAENISYYPVWIMLDPHERVRFTLVFERLPSDCVMFDLIEEIPQSGGFEVRGIVRNRSDVYRVKIT